MRSLLASFIMLLAAPAAQAQLACSQIHLRSTVELTAHEIFRNYEASHTLSQKIRDNAPGYWATVRRQVRSDDWSSLPVALRNNLIVVGDLHSGNFSIFQTRTSGIRYTLYDIKDLGLAPGLFDLNRLILNTLAVAGRGRSLNRSFMRAITDDLMHSYGKGLQRQNFALTEKFEDHVPSERKYERELRKKMEKVIQGDRFVVRPGEVEPLTVAARHLGVEVQTLRSEIEHSMRNSLGWGRLLDAVTRPRERGGSKENLRIWVHYELADGTRLFKELKELTSTSTSYYGPQPPFAEVLQGASRYLDYKIDDVSPVVEVRGRMFFVRDKKVEFISVPYRQKKEKEFEELMKMAKAHAVWLGTFHSRQLADSGQLRTYEDAYHETRDRLREFFVEFNRRYITHIEEAIP